MSTVTLHYDKITEALAKSPHGRIIPLLGRAEAEASTTLIEAIHRDLDVQSRWLDEAKTVLADARGSWWSRMCGRAPSADALDRCNDLLQRVVVHNRQSVTIRQMDLSEANNALSDAIRLANRLDSDENQSDAHRLQARSRAAILTQVKAVNDLALTQLELRDHDVESAAEFAANVSSSAELAVALDRLQTVTNTVTDTQES